MLRISQNFPMRRIEGLIDIRVREFERRCLLRMLRKAKGNLRQVAIYVDTRRSRLYRMMKRHGIKLNEIRKEFE